eukprot:GHVR01173009.1.p1 GENE.GHVR01173009.1~~GHVR01173009.1.p1  ORF type:complete len:100 (-),score=18.83 GHVR01173009.1:383-682(-)
MYVYKSQGRTSSREAASVEIAILSGEISGMTPEAAGFQGRGPLTRSTVEGFWNAFRKTNIINKDGKSGGRIDTATNATGARMLGNFTHLPSVIDTVDHN